MDESRKSGAPAPAKYPWQNDDVSMESLGATGVFGAAPESVGDPGRGPVAENDQNAAADDLRNLVGIPPHASVRSGGEPLREPVVHKVVLGGVKGAAPTELHSLLRPNSSAEEPTRGGTVPASQSRPWTASEPVVARFPESPSGQSSQGFTQLLRALGGDSPSAATTEQPDFVQPLEVKSAAVTPESRPAGTDTGFTSLLRTLNPNQQNSSPNGPPAPLVTTPAVPTPESAGGFTALLQGFSETGDSGERKPNGTPPYGNQGSPSPANFHTAPVPVADRSTPGGFTQLLSALNPEASSSVAAEPVAMNPQVASPLAIFPEQTAVSRQAGSGSSFTQLLSTLGEPPQKAPVYEDHRTEPLDDFSERSTLRRQDSSAAGQFSTGVTDWSRTTLPPTEPSRGSGSLTQLIRILDEPSKEPENTVAYPTEFNPVAPPPASGSMFTETYRKLDGRTEAPSPEPPPSYSQPSRLSATQPIPFQSAGGAFPNQWPPTTVDPTLPAGPSEVTRILDMSKMREMQRPGTVAPAQASPVASSPAPVSVPMPQMPLNFQWQPPVVPIPPGQPHHFGGAMQMPQYPPPAPLPQLPASVAAPATGKMQQYLPLLLIIIIFLLVVILVTVVFLLKH